MKRFLLPLLMVFAIAALLIGTAPANAGFKLSLNDGSTFITIADGDMNDSGAGAGVIVYNGSVGTNWVVNVTTGISKNIIGSASAPEMDLNSVNVTSTGPGTLTMFLTDTDFLVPGQEYGLSLINEWGGTTGGTVVAQGSLDPGNEEFTLPGTIGSFDTPFQGPFGPGAFSDTVSSSIGAGELEAGEAFSLLEAVRIVHSGAGQVTSFDKRLVVVPEPGTMLLIGTGLIGLAGLGRRKLFKK